MIVTAVNQTWLNFAVNEMYPFFWIHCIKRQECIPEGYVPPTAVAIGGVSTRHPPGPCTPQDHAPPRAIHPPDHAPPRTTCPTGPYTPPGTMHPPPDNAPPGPCTAPCGQTQACKHITLPQTSFAGSNKSHLTIGLRHDGRRYDMKIWQRWTWQKLA